MVEENYCRTSPASAPSAELKTKWAADYLIGGNIDCPTDTLLALSQHECHRVRTRVAEHPRTAAEVLRELSRDTHPDVRVAVAGNPQTTEEVRFALLADQDPTVRYAIAEDANTPEHHLRLLISDENAYVACRATETYRRMMSKPSVHHVDWSQRGKREENRRDRAFG